MSGCSRSKADTPGKSQIIGSGRCRAFAKVFHIVFVTSTVCLRDSLLMVNARSTPSVANKNAIAIARTVFTHGLCKPRSAKCTNIPSKLLEALILSQISKVKAWTQYSHFCVEFAAFLTMVGVASRFGFDKSVVSSFSNIVLSTSANPMSRTFSIHATNDAVSSSLRLITLAILKT